MNGITIAQCGVNIEKRREHAKLIPKRTEKKKGEALPKKEKKAKSNLFYFLGARQADVRHLLPNAVLEKKRTPQY